MLDHLPHYSLLDIVKWMSFDEWLSMKKTCKHIQTACNEPWVERHICLRTARHVRGATPALMQLAVAGHTDALLLCAQDMFLKAGNSHREDENILRSSFLFLERYFSLSDEIYISPREFDGTQLIFLDAGRIANETVSLISYVHLHTCYHLRLVFLIADDDIADDDSSEAKDAKEVNEGKAEEGQARFIVQREWIDEALQRLHDYYDLLEDLTFDDFTQETVFCSSPRLDYRNEVSLKVSRNRKMPIDRMRQDVVEIPVFIETRQKMQTNALLPLTSNILQYTVQNIDDEIDDGGTVLTDNAVAALRRHSSWFFSAASVR